MLRHSCTRFVHATPDCRIGHARFTRAAALTVDSSTQYCTVPVNTRSLARDTVGPVTPSQLLPFRHLPSSARTSCDKAQLHLRPQHGSCAFFVDASPPSRFLVAALHGFATPPGRSIQSSQSLADNTAKPSLPFLRIETTPSFWPISQYRGPRESHRIIHLLRLSVFYWAPVSDRAVRQFNPFSTNKDRPRISGWALSYRNRIHHLRTATHQGELAQCCSDKNLMAAHRQLLELWR